MTTVHKNLTGADLHEPKGADTATAGKIYVSDGAGSGSWVTASSVITNTAFSTGDLKLTHKVTADTGWILWASSSIGDGSSGAGIRANADCASLFALYWDNYNNTLCPIFTSAGAVSTRGVSAAADFAAHKRLAIPVANGYSLGIAGTGSGLTARTLGSPSGSETNVLIGANLPPYTPTGTVGSVFSSGTTSITIQGDVAHPGGSPTGSAFQGSNTTGTTSLTGTSAGTVTSTFTGSAQGGTSTAFSIMQPTQWVNVMIKL